MQEARSEGYNTAMPDAADSATDTSCPATVSSEAGVLQRIIKELSSLPRDAQQRILDAVCVFLGLIVPSRAALEPQLAAPQVQPGRNSSFQFSEVDPPAVKHFLSEKNPQTDVERVACLAFYLARYRAMPHIKTKDITELNKESAHRSFSNTAVAVDNATKAGYLVPSIKGSKQISAYGERFVEALPDRDAAKQIMAAARVGTKRKANRKKVTGAE